MNLGENFNKNYTKISSNYLEISGIMLERERERERDSQANLF
jgi:hypothetical protein